MKLTEDQVQWVVNDMAELGVKIGEQFFFLYKGRSLNYAADHMDKPANTHDDGQKIKWRYVGKREFGECCHPWYAIKQQTGEERLPDTYVNFYPEESQTDNDNPWRDMP